jgi:hypothetical protein
MKALNVSGKKKGSNVEFKGTFDNIMRLLRAEFGYEYEDLGSILSSAVVSPK